LRTLGETGILGFITFYGCIGIILFMAVKYWRDPDYLVSGMSIGLLGGSLGLLLNAIYIDVFAASKVAQTYWALAGLFIGYLVLRERQLHDLAFQPIPSQTTQPVKESKVTAAIRKKRTAKTHASTKSKKTSRR
jgi:hypothetical protein